MVPPGTVVRGRADLGNCSPKSSHDFCYGATVASPVTEQMASRKGLGFYGLVSSLSRLDLSDGAGGGGGTKSQPVSVPEF